MCPSSSPSRNICFMCGANHAAADGTRALVPAAVAPVSTPRTLAGMPVVIGSHILGFEPDAARAFQVASRTLQRMSTHFLALHARETGALCAPERSTLYSLVNNCFTYYQPHFASFQPTLIRFLLSIPVCIRQLGALDCRPNTILASPEIAQFNQRIEDENLTRIWSEIYFRVTRANPGLQGVPEAGTPADNIRRWMHENQLVLQGISELNLYSNLTCVPLEIRLCTGLQVLRLNNNRLTFLHENLFQGLSGLLELYLNYNSLETLPEGIFNGLVALRRLDLDKNMLVTLPRRIFQGLERLRVLDLAFNRLISLPDGIFQGLTALGALYLVNNPSLMISLVNVNFFGNPHTGYQGTNIAFRETMHTFFSYACESPLAQLYQLAAGCQFSANNPGTPEAMRRVFSQLPDTIKNAIFGSVWVEAGRPNTRDHQWGEHHAFDDNQIFCKALKRLIIESFSNLSVEQRNTVYGHVYDLARNEPGAESVYFDSPQWGEIHACDNILRLIDAMMRLQR